MAILFDTNTDYVRIADNAALTFPDADWAIQGWGKLANNSASAAERWFDWDNGSSPAIRLYITQSAGAQDELHLRVYDGFDAADIESTSSPFASNTNWTHVLAQRSGSNFELYINGSSVGTVAVGTVDAMDVPEFFYIGQYGLVQDRAFDGHLAEYAKWDRALTADEIAALAKGFSPIFFKNSLMWYCPLVRDYIEVIRNLTVSQSGTSVGPHPRMIYPAYTIIGPMSLNKIYPDAIAASTNLTGAVTDIDEDPTAADANWLTATSATADTDLRVTFPSVTPNPSAGQSFKAWVRKTAGSPNPTIDISLYENGSSVRKIVSASSVSNTTGEIFQANWNASELTTASGANVECRIYGYVGLGSTPSFVNKGTASATSGTSLTPTYPASMAENDLLILVVGSTNADSGNLNTVTTPANFTKINPAGASDFEGSDIDGQIATYYRYVPAAGLSGTLSITVATPSSGTSAACYAQFYAFRGVATSSPFEGGELKNGTGTTVTMPAITTTAANRLCVAFTMIGSNTTVAAATGETGGDWTESAAEDGSAQGNDGTLSCQQATMAAAGTITGGTFTVTSGGWASRGFALKPIPTNTVEIGAIDWISNSALPVTQNLTAPLVTNTPTFYDPTLFKSPYPLVPALFTNTPTLYGPTLVKSPYPLTAPLIDNTPTFYGVSLAQSLVAPLITNTPTFYSPTLVKSVYPLTAPLITNTPTFYGPTLAATYSLTAPLLTNSPTLHGPTLVKSPYSLTAPLITNSPAFYDPTLLKSPYPLTAPLITNTPAFYGPTLVKSSYSLVAPLITNTPTFYGPTFSTSAAQNITAPLLTNTPTFYGATLVYPQSIDAPLVTSSLTFYNATMRFKWIDVNNVTTGDWTDGDFPFHTI